jgi:hypothetical protein
MGNGSTVRDHLCQIIREHQLDPNLVKALFAFSLALAQRSVAAFISRQTFLS